MSTLFFFALGSFYFLFDYLITFFLQVVDEHFIDLKNAKGVSDSRPKFSKVPYIALYVFVFIYYMFICTYAYRL